MFNATQIYIHNSIPDISYFAKVCYDKLDKEYSIKSLVEFAKNVLWQNKHMSVFEHIWIYINNFDLKKYFQLIKLLLNYQLEEYVNQIYYDNGKKILSFNARTLMELYTKLDNREILIPIIEKIPYMKYLLDIDNTISNTNDIYQFRYKKVKTVTDIKLVGFTEDIIENPKVYLVSNVNNNSKFAAYTFYLENIPLFVRDHIVRHRFGVFAIKSYRYTKPKHYYLINNLSEDTKDLYDILMGFIYRAYEYYYKNRKVRKEKARALLPTNITTKIFWTVPKISLDNFITLRTDIHAQEETRLIALAIKELIEEVS